jgi:hypothetical protein
MLPSMLIVEKIAQQRICELEREAQLNLAIRMANANLPVHRRSFFCRVLAALGQKMARFGLDLQRRYGEEYKVQTIAR